MSESNTKFRPTPDSYINWLEKRGYRQLGRGAYSSVFEHPKRKDIVVKVNRATDSWPTYISWATGAGYAGTFAPKVYSLKGYKGFYVATMERLPETLNELRARGAMTANVAKQEDIIIGYHRVDKRGHKPLREFANDLRATGFNHDLHGGNIMVRKNGRLVVTDPAGSNWHPTTRIKRGAIIDP